MILLRLIAALVTACSVLLSACGGGGQDGGTIGVPDSGTSIPNHGTPRTAPLRFGYFWLDGDQIAETADHVGYVFTQDSGDWALPQYDAFRAADTIVRLQQARQLGIKEAWVSIGWLVFTAHRGCTGYCYTPRPDAIPRLLAFREQLQAAGVDDMVTVLYPSDEPDSRGLSEQALAPLLTAIRAAWPVKLAVIYSGDNNRRPGLTTYDLVGVDHYDEGAGILDHLPPITGSQQYLLVPGGCD